jgi:hypothetical protein
MLGLLRRSEEFKDRPGGQDEGGIVEDAIQQWRIAEVERFYQAGDRGGL